MLNRFRLLICLVLFASSNGFAGLKQPVPATQSPWDANLNLSVADFLSALASQDPLERRYAEMYFLGVMETSEGRIWCDYGKVLPHELFAHVQEDLMKLPPSVQKERAAHVMTDRLGKLFPCKRSKK